MRSLCREGLSSFLVLKGPALGTQPSSGATRKEKQPHTCFAWQETRNIKNNGKLLFLKPRGWIAAQGFLTCPGEPCLRLTPHLVSQRRDEGRLPTLWVSWWLDWSGDLIFILTN